LSQELYPSGHRRVTRYFGVDDGRRDVIFVDWADITFERSRRTGVLTRASLLDRAARNFTATVHYAPDDSPLVTAQTMTFTAGPQSQGRRQHCRRFRVSCSEYGWGVPEWVTDTSFGVCLGQAYY